MGVEARIVRWLLWLSALGITAGLIYALRAVLSPILFAFMLAYVLDPVVDRFEAAKIPRVVGISVLLVLVLGVTGLFMVLVVPTIVADVVQITRLLPDTFARWMVALQELAREWGFDLPSSWSDVMARFGGDMGVFAQGLLSPLSSIVQQVVGSTASMLAALSALVMIPVFSFYLLHDFDLIVARIAELVPPRIRPHVADIATEIDDVLSQFMRGQITVMAILAILYSSAYALAGVSLAIPIGIVAGMLSFIPYVGGAAALILALLMVALHWTGWTQLIAVVCAYTAIQLLESFVITPRVVGDKLGLSPVWVLFAMLAGAELFGFTGVLLSLPMAAVIKVFVLRAVTSYRASEFYSAPDAETAAASAGAFSLILPEPSRPPRSQVPTPTSSQSASQAPAAPSLPLPPTATPEDEAP